MAPVPLGPLYRNQAGSDPIVTSACSCMSRERLSLGAPSGPRPFPSPEGFVPPYPTLGPDGPAQSWADGLCPPR
eukprot:27812-Karenia_brevis.AAC.1